MADPWYPPASEYYVPEGEVALYPVRQGDVFPPPQDADDWAGSVVVSPSCEVQRKGVDVQVARIRRISDLLDAFQRTAVTYGFDTRDPAIVKVAFAHTFWMPPAAETGPLSDALFADFRDVRVVPQAALDRERRVRAMTHDARVHFIRRKLYFRYRWLLSVDDVRALEAQRIAGDPDFIGPRPAWATLEAGSNEPG